MFLINALSRRSYYLSYIHIINRRVSCLIETSVLPYISSIYKYKIVFVFPWHSSTRSLTPCHHGTFRLHSSGIITLATFIHTDTHTHITYSRSHTPHNTPRNTSTSRTHLRPSDVIWLQRRLDRRWHIFISTPQTTILRCAHGWPGFAATQTDILTGSMAEPLVTGRQRLQSMTVKSVPERRCSSTCRIMTPVWRIR